MKCTLSVHSCSWTKHARRISARSSKAIRARPKRHSEEETRTLTSSPVVLSQILTVLSFDPLTMCLPSGEYATEDTVFECPVSVHSCSWPKHGGQNQCTQRSIDDDKVGHSPPCLSENPRPSRYCPPTRSRCACRLASMPPSAPGPSAPSACTSAHGPTPHVSISTRSSKR